MKALSRESAELIDAARRGERKLTPASRAASRAKILARVGAAAGAAGLAASASTATATTAGALGVAPVVGLPIASTVGVSLAAKVGLSLLVVAGVVGGVVTLTRPSAPGAPMAGAPLAVVSGTASVGERLTTASAQLTAARAPGPIDPAPTMSASTRDSRDAPSATPTTRAPVASISAASEDPLATENALLARAQQAIASGNAGQALAVLDEHARRFPRGMLAPEREAARAIALCGAGRTSEGRAQAAPFVKDDADSPIAKRIRGACGM